MKEIPEEWLQCLFVFEDDTFTADYDLVEVDYTTPEDNEFRQDKVKRWTISNNSYTREIHENEVEYVLVTVKDEYLDKETTKKLPSGDE